MWGNDLCATHTRLIRRVRDEVIADLTEGSAQILLDHGYDLHPNPAKLTKAQKDRRDKMLAVLGPLLENAPEIFDDRVRGRAIAKLEKNKVASAKTVHQAFDRFWRRGMSVNALTPAFANCGRGKRKPGETKLGRRPTKGKEELLYSAIARSCRYLQAPEVGPFMRELMGRRWAVASVDLPGQLNELARDLPNEERDAAVDAWLDGATLLPFYTAFMSDEVRGATRATMRGDTAGLHARLGLAAFKICSPDRLRFCPDCLADMEGNGGDCWWRRDHQLPGVTVCPVHGEVLRLSDAALGDGNRHAFVAATRVVCRADAPLALEGVEGGDLVLMAELARRAAALLSSPPPARSYGETMDRYRGRLTEVGLMRSRRRVDHAALHAAFRERWGRVSELIPGLKLIEDQERSWLSALVRNRRRAAHPLQHLMLEAMLDGLAVVPADEPFGAGPWPCRNPAADHHGQPMIGTVELRRDRGVIYGDFACSCGYLYTRSRSAEGAMGEPRYRRFGPLLAPALEAAMARGAGLRTTARALGLDPKTLMREAAMAGVLVPWSTRASGAVPAPETPISYVRPRAFPRRRRRPLRNWFAIDIWLARRARAAAIVIAAEEPPVRVTFAAVERKVASRDWVQKRRTKLPQTVASIVNAVETTDGFRRRRLDWLVSDAPAAGDLRPCDVLRAAGLPMDWLPQVRAAIAAARCPETFMRMVA